MRHTLHRCILLSAECVSVGLSDICFSPIEHVSNIEIQWEATTQHGQRTAKVIEVGYGMCATMADYITDPFGSLGVLIRTSDRNNAIVIRSQPVDNCNFSENSTRTESEKRNELKQSQMTRPSSR